MIVISDTTPLITLMKAGRLDILPDLFGEVLVPEAVFLELTENNTYRDEADTIRNSPYIRQVKVKDVAQVAFLRRVTGLDLGESEAIIYADEEKADLLLMDEAAGRRVALNMRIPITGSVGILIQAFQAGIVSEEEAEDAFDQIRKANRHISEKLINKALDIIRGVK